MDVNIFGFKILKYTRTAFERQILESVIIQEVHKKSNILNSKSEYNRCALPRLTSKLGEQAYGEEEKKRREEKMKEEDIEDRIRKLRKDIIGRKRQEENPTLKGACSRKKRRLNLSDYVTIEKIQDLEHCNEQEQVCNLEGNPPNHTHHHHPSRSALFEPPGMAGPVRPGGSPEDLLGTHHHHPHNHHGDSPIREGGVVPNSKLNNAQPTDHLCSSLELVLNESKTQTRIFFVSNNVEVEVEDPVVEGEVEKLDDQYTTVCLSPPHYSMFLPYTTNFFLLRSVSLKKSSSKH